MNRSRFGVVVALFALIVGGAFGYDFDHWFPYLYRNAQWVEAHSNNLAKVEHPYSGIWGMDTNRVVQLLALVHVTRAGLWMMNTNGHIVLNTNVWWDTFWETNGVGLVVLKAVP